MYFLSWSIIGLLAGWLAEKIFKGNGYGPLMDIVIGIGAVGGGFLTRSAGFSGYRAETEFGVAEAVKLEEQERPEKDANQKKREAGNLEAAPQKNQKTFHP
jgi:uncharacterized membrane protein YeaQ/YmgE (transglycosylase-associated protein family)